MKDWYDFLNPNEQPEGKCAFCGEPTDKTYCNDDCKTAALND